MSARRGANQASTSLRRVRALVDNPLPGRVVGGVIALIGDRPSAYSRSPHIWTAALRHLGLVAVYLPLDVRADRLEAVLSALRETDACWGANVTVPYKRDVLPLLDDVDPLAAAAGAVNTIVRRRGGRLVGSNTDGVGVVAALLHDEGDGPLLETIHGQRVLLIGAGGAARAAGMALAPLLGSGELVVNSRTYERACDLARQVASVGARVRAVVDDDLDRVLPEVDLVINASLRGQAGIRRGPEGWTSLEPYSALGPASPAVLPPMPEPEFWQAWTAASAGDIATNHERSEARLRRLRRDAVVFDMVYAPPETVTMRHARAAGLRAAGGRWMMIVQAAEACVTHICARVLARHGVDRESARSAVIRAMAEAWEEHQTHS